MAKVMVVYWSGGGNTEKMAEAVVKGAKEKGAEVECKAVSGASVDELAGFDAVAFGSPAMGAEVIEEGEMEPFFSSALPKLSGKKVAVFGSYDWGDGEWLRTWEGRVKDGGATLIGSVKAHLEPDDAALAECVALGANLVG
ncbi:MAG: flavodoxin [Synergistaceae bacterium]|nr:flavodoxin [Synergistaceae bacterium]